jgi:hypothetical protein
MPLLTDSSASGALHDPRAADGMDPKEITGPDADMHRKMERIAEKEKRGEPLTPREKGVKGAMANMEIGAAAEKRAAREGREDEYRKEHATRSWMKGEDTRKPSLSQETEREVERIRKKEARGETLTRHEAGVLGGASRAKDVE